MAKSRSQEKIQKRVSMARQINLGIDQGRQPRFKDKVIKRAFMACENLCVEYEDGSWERLENKRDRNYIYHQCLWDRKSSSS